MSITLTNQITETDLKGNNTTITNIKCAGFKATESGGVEVEYIDSNTGALVEKITFDAASAVINIIGQIDTYVVNNGLVAGTKD